MKTHRSFIRTIVLAGILCLGLGILNSVPVSADSDANKRNPYVHDGPYVAEPYVPPPPPESKVKLHDNGDGTITDLGTGLIWAQVDSHADLGHCLNWYGAGEYVKNLRTAGYDDWRMPSLAELISIYDDTQESVIGVDLDPRFPLAISDLFAKGAANWYWTSDYEETNLTECCARTFYFVRGMTQVRRFTLCTNGGVRAVRGPASVTLDPTGYDR